MWWKKWQLVPVTSDQEPMPSNINNLILLLTLLLVLVALAWTTSHDCFASGKVTSNHCHHLEISTGGCKEVAMTKWQ